MTLQIYKIASTTLSAAAANIEFTNIPQGYTDLKLVVSTRPDSSGSADLNVYFNNSTTGYTTRRLLGTGSSVISDTQAPSQLREQAPTYTANTFSSGELYIPNYTSSNNKSHSGDSVSENNATSAIQMLTAGLWSNTAAITSIKIENYTAGNNFAKHSTATLYGIL